MTPAHLNWLRLTTGGSMSLTPSPPIKATSGKNARTPMEIEKEVRIQKTEDIEAKVKMLIEQKCSDLSEKGLLIKQWDLDFLGADLTWCGRSGSPTKVHRIQSVVLAAKESKDVEPSENGISGMIHELIDDKIIA